MIKSRHDYLCRRWGNRPYRYAFLYALGTVAVTSDQTMCMVYLRNEFFVCPSRINRFTGLEVLQPGKVVNPLRGLATVVVYPKEIP